MMRYNGYILMSVLFMATMQHSDAKTRLKGLQESAELFVKFADILHINLLENVDILRNVIKDPILLQVTTETMNTNIDELTKLVKELDEFEHEKPQFDAYIHAIGRFNAFRILETAILRYLEPEHITPTFEDKLIKASILKRGYGNARTKLLQRFAEYTVEMITVVDRNIAELTDEEKEDNEERIRTYNEVKTESDIAKKFKIFSDSLPEYGYNISEFH